jgi:hypothetical protein
MTFVPHAQIKSERDFRAARDARNRERERAARQLKLAVYLGIGLLLMLGVSIAALVNGAPPLPTPTAASTVR